MGKQYYYQNVKYVIVKNQEAKGLLSNLGIRTPLSKVPILGDILFWMYTCLKDTSCSQRIKWLKYLMSFY